MSTHSTWSASQTSGAAASAAPGVPAVHGPPLAWLLTVPLMCAGLVDVPRRLTAGPLTALGGMTILQIVVVVLGLLRCRSYPYAVIRRMGPYLLFLIWAAMRGVSAQPDVAGFQNALVYALFGLQATLAAVLVTRRVSDTHRIIAYGMNALEWIAFVLVAASLFRSGLPTGDDEWIVGERSISLLALVPLSWQLAHWHHGSATAGGHALAWLLVVLASLSRTATAAALLNLAIVIACDVRWSPVRLLRRAPLLVLAGGLFAAVVVTYSSQFHDRFFEGDTSVDVWGIPVSTSGRSNVWPVVIESAWKHPIVGQGLGSSQRALSDFSANEVAHPHNDYLRVWHDTGAIGLLALAYAIVGWLWALAKSWRIAARADDRGAEMLLAALLTLLSVAIAAFTDNTLIYPFVMAAAGVVVGAGLGLTVSTVRSTASSGDARTACLA